MHFVLDGWKNTDGKFFESEINTQWDWQTFWKPGVTNTPDVYCVIMFQMYILKIKNQFLLIMFVLFSKNNQKNARISHVCDLLNKTRKSISLFRTYLSWPKVFCSPEKKEEEHAKRVFFRQTKDGRKRKAQWRVADRSRLYEITHVRRAGVIHWRRECIVIWRTRAINMP